MKRIIKVLAVVMIISACLAAVSCGGNFNMDGKDKDWVFVMVSNDRTGEIEYASLDFAQSYLEATDGKEKLEAKVVDLGFKAYDGKFAITDRNTQIQYIGSYVSDGESRDGANYKITLDYEGEKLEGKAAVTETKLHDDTKEYTLILVIGNKTIYFKSIQ